MQDKDLGRAGTWKALARGGRCDERREKGGWPPADTVIFVFVRACTLLPARPPGPPAAAARGGGEEVGSRKGEDGSSSGDPRCLLRPSRRAAAERELLRVA